MKWRLGVVVGAVFLAACPPPVGGPDGGGVDAGDAGASAACTPDVAAIAARRECVSDDQCPCGSHCELGVCVATCSQTAACASGQACDRFGRCRAADDQTLMGTVPATTVGALRVETPSLVAGTNASPTRLALSATLGDVAMRVTASAPFEVRCAGGGSFGPECTFTLAAGLAGSVEVRQPDGATVTTPGVVQLYFGRTSRAVTVFPVDRPEQAQPPAAGLYEGTASLVGGGISTDGGSANFRGLTVPVRLRVYAGVAQLEDPFKALGSSGTWVGALQVAAGRATLQLPRWQLERDAITATDFFDAVAEPAATPLQYDPKTQVLGFELALSVRGVTEGVATTTLRWSVALSRTGDLPAGAPPAVTAPVALPMPRAATETTWEAATLNSLPPWLNSGRTTPDYDLLLATSGDVQPASGACSSSSCPRALDACARDARTANGMGATVVIPQSIWNTRNTQMWPTAPFSSGTPVDVASVSQGRPLAAVLLRPVLDRVTGVSNLTLTTDMDGGVPCAATFGSNASNTCLPGAVPYGAVDRCAEIAARVGCEPVDIPTNRPVFNVGGTLSLFSSGSGACSSDAGVTGQVTRMCRYRENAPCAELLNCQVGSTLATAAIDRASSPHARGGDLDCVRNGTSVASLATKAELTTETTAALAGAVAATCFTELARVRTTVPATGGPGGAALDTLFPSTSVQCLDAARHLVALGFATQRDRDRALGLSTTVDLRDSRYAHRLAQQWLEVHALLANESSQRLAVPDAALTGLSSLPTLAAPRTVLDRSVSGWSLLLHPRFSSALEQLPAAVLANPDYRLPLAPGISAVQGHAQGTGVPVAMVDTLRAQLGLARSLIEDAARRQDRTVLVNVGHLFRVLGLAEVLARRLAERSFAQGTPAWAQTWERSLRAYEQSRDDTLTAAIALQRGANPLGIEDGDLPLYFFGGATDPSARFSAVSDYLLGVGASTTAWAPALVANATAAATDMRTAYATQATRQYQEALSVMDADNRLGDIRAEAGGTIVNLCGTPAGLTTENVLEGWEAAAGRPFRSGDCFHRTEAAGCMRSPSATLALPDVTFQLCATMMMNSFTGGAVQYGNPALNELSRARSVTSSSAADVDTALRSAFDPRECTAATCVGGSPPDSFCMQCGSLFVTTSASELANRVGIERVSQQTRTRAEIGCGPNFPTARTNLFPFLPKAVDPRASAQCLSGSLGELAMTVQAAATDLDIAKAEADSLSRAYDISMRSCLIQQAGDMKVAEATDSHNATMDSLSRRKQAADAASHIAGAVKDCADIAGGEQKQFSGGAASVVGCGAAFAEAAANIVSDEMQRQMDEADRNHSATIAKMEANTAFQVCINDATMELVGVRAANLRITRSLSDLGTAELNLREGLQTAQRAFDEGTAELEDARGRRFRPPALDGYVSENVSKYQRSMRLARRMTYLSVRAVEWEYQASMSARQDVLVADTPAQLQQVIDGLRATAGTRRVNGNAPSALKTVVSLRSHILQLADRSSLTPIEQKLTDVELFRLRLQTRYAVFGPTGQFLGVRVPFALSPLGNGRPGNGMGLTLFSASDCAERVWSVNASILGRDTMYRGSETTFTRVSLEKSNTFFSQWCGGAPANGPEFQQGSVRPSVNLFRDPEFGPGMIGSTSLGSNLGVGNAVDATTQARIQAYFNVPRAMFEADSYANGETAELAGRGLYGEYILVIPPEVISRRQVDGSFSNGLDLDQVDDVLLRLDYVSVANR